MLCHSCADFLHHNSRHTPAFRSLGSISAAAAAVWALAAAAAGKDCLLGFLLSGCAAVFCCCSSAARRRFLSDSDIFFLRAECESYPEIDALTVALCGDCQSTYRPTVGKRVMPGMMLCKGMVTSSKRACSSQLASLLCAAAAGGWTKRSTTFPCPAGSRSSLLPAPTVRG